MSDKQKHLELIQGVINRFSKNSFLLKGWSVTLVSALFAFSVSNCQTNLIYFAYIPTTVLWGLDGFFLWQEELFRKLYNCVRNIPENAIDFSMDVSQITDKKRPTWMRATFSKTIIPFHGMLILPIVIMTIINLCTKR